MSEESETHKTIEDLASEDIELSDAAAKGVVGGNAGNAGNAGGDHNAGNAGNAGNSRRPV